MSSQYKKQISRDDYLRALALFTLAHEHYVEARRFGEALNRIIMADPKETWPGGHVDDAIYCDDRGSTGVFDEALRRTGIKVVDADAAEGAEEQS